MVDLKKHPDASSSVKKEVCIQKILSHHNILKFFGKRTQGDVEYIFLEYAAGGELFDRIGKQFFYLHFFLHLLHTISLQNPTSAWQYPRHNAISIKSLPALSIFIHVASPIVISSRKIFFSTIVTILRYQILEWQLCLGNFFDCCTHLVR
jgi:serine/threonine protein kinase